MGNDTTTESDDDSADGEDSRRGGSGGSLAIQSLQPVIQSPAKKTALFGGKTDFNSDEISTIQHSALVAGMLAGEQKLSSNSKRKGKVRKNALLTRSKGQKI